MSPRVYRWDAGYRRVAIALKRIFPDERFSMKDYARERKPVDYAASPLIQVEP